MSTKTLLISFAALLLGVSLSRAAENLAAIPSSGPTTPTGWYDDYDLALKAAQTDQKKLYILFTGSDWCGWCKKLKADVLDTNSFKEFAAGKLILLYIDLPSPKVKMSEELRKTNRELTEKFRVRGFPTSVLLDAQGEEISKISGAPADYLDRLKKAAE